MKRSSNFELLRIVSILLILSMHIFSQVAKDNLLLFNSYLGTFISSIGNIGVSCFILISGYFGINLNWKKVIQLIFLTTIYTVFVYFINSFGSISLSGFLQAFFVVPLYKNWFITCYLLLMLFSPWLNSFIDTCTQKKLEKLIIILFIAFCMIPTFTNKAYHTVITDGGKCLIYCIFIYILGRYLHDYRDIQIPRYKSGAVWGAMTAIIFSLNVVTSIIIHKPCYIFAMDCSQLILISSVATFYFFKFLKFNSSFINWIASSVIAVFLMDGLRIFIDKYLMSISLYADSYKLGLYLLTEVILVFIIAVLIDKIRVFLFSSVEKKFIDKILVYTQRIYIKLKNKYKNELLHFN